jgi:hypothetical protein
MQCGDINCDAGQNKQRGRLQRKEAFHPSRSHTTLIWSVNAAKSDFLK